MSWLLLAAAVLAALVAGCDLPPEQKVFILQRDCLRHAGSPLVEDGKFIRCEYQR